MERTYLQEIQTSLRACNNVCWCVIFEELTYRMYRLSGENLPTGCTDCLERTYLQEVQTVWRELTYRMYRLSG